MGRQSLGVDRVPHGITVLSMMDYHAVGSRRGAFEVAVQVAGVDRGYREGLVEWCVIRGVGHWEEKGRGGIAKALGRIFQSDKSNIVTVLERLVASLWLTADVDWISFQVGCLQNSWEFTCYWGNNTGCI